MKPVFFLAIFLVIPANYSFAHIIDTETGFSFEYRAELAEVAPVVDGFLDDPAWKEAQPGILGQDVIEGVRWHESGDFKGTFAAVWRNGFLYLAVQLTDDSIETHHEKLSRQDHLEIYLDIDHTGHKSDLYRYVIPVGRSISPSNTQRMLIAWGNGGQSCELSFNLGYRLQKGEIIGFGIYYNDADQGRLHHRISWGPMGQIESEDTLADLIFTAKLKPDDNQKPMQWGRIKSLY